jgi:hypothetical protein
MVPVPYDLSFDQGMITGRNRSLKRRPILSVFEEETNIWVDIDEN